MRMHACCHISASFATVPSTSANPHAHTLIYQYISVLPQAACYLHVQQRVRRARHAGELADLGHGLGLGRPLHLAPLRLELRVARVLAQALART